MKIHSYFYLLLVAMCLILFSRCKKAPAGEKMFYANDMEQGDLSKITGGILKSYTNTRVLGFYNKGGFSVKLEGLPSHDFIKIAFDLYIHDSWDGNTAGSRGVLEGPDRWSMKADGETYINTTFSNSTMQQSFPFNYPFHTDAKTGASRTDLPGVCHSGPIPGGTSLYRIEKLIHHKGGSIKIDFNDSLLQSNAADPLCDESWSLDNLVISTAILN